MTDRDIIERAATILNTSTKGPYPPGPNSNKEHYRAEVFSKNAASWMMTLYPLLGERRRETVKNSLGIWKNQRLKNPNGAGRRNPRCKSEGK